jgi:acyl-coenzyme A synthetase/AMP-(fatty) acid ligase
MSVHTILEDILLTHPVVADAAVLPTPDEHAGEVPVAFIVPRHSALERELIAWVAEHLSPYPRIRRVEFVDEIPGTIRPASELP